MAFSILHNILYGPYRPWIKEEKSQISLPEEPFEGDYEIDWWGRVEPIKPFNRAAMAYSKNIKRSVHHRLQEMVSLMRATEAETDRSYLITTAVWEIEDFIREAHGVQRERSSGKKMVQYVTDMLIRELLNLRRELLLRYPSPQKHDPSVENAYLRLLDRPAPSPSPFGFTLEYDEYRLRQALPAVVPSDSDKPVSVQPLLEIWHELAIMITAQNTFDHVGRAKNLMYHTENALFLVKAGAAFIEAEPERLSESEHCRLWAIGMIEDAMEDGVPDTEACQTLYAAGMWVRNGLAPVYKMLPEITHSSAIRWTFKMNNESLSGDITKPGQKAAAADSSENKITGFAQDFKKIYVHRQELMLALGVGRKTLNSYLEGADVRELKLKANYWYRRKDVERFLEENEG